MEPRLSHIALARVQPLGHLGWYVSVGLASPGQALQTTSLLLAELFGKVVLRLVLQAQLLR